MNEAQLQYIRSLTEDPYPNPDYRICITPVELAQYLDSSPAHHFHASRILACDTESLPTEAPYCFTFSHTPGTGRLVYASNIDTLRAFDNYLSIAKPLLLFHNYLYDAQVFTQLGLPIYKFLDTMVRAYVLCLGGGGDEEDTGGSRAGRGFLSLKIMAWRFLHMRMTSFKDTVYPHSMPRLLDWLELGELAFRPDAPVVHCECGCPRPAHLHRGKSGKLMGRCGRCACPGYKLRAKGKAESKVQKPLALLHRKVKMLASEMRELLDNRALALDLDDEDDAEPEGGTGKALDPWKRYKGWHDYDREALVGCLGPVPLPSIEYVPEPELLTYACRDADATLRLYLHMRLLRPWLLY